MAEEDLNGTGTPFSLSFSGSGFLALYQIGVVQSLLELAPEILKSASKVYGASAGSLIAAAHIMRERLRPLAVGRLPREKTILGPLSPGCNTLRTIQKGLYKMLPENSHQVASGRLHISLTRMMDGQNVMVSEFSSKEDLIQALICSCFVPIYCGFIPPSFRGVRYVDGGFTNLQPCSDLEAVITVSPFTGELDICPRDCPAIFYSFQIFNSSIQISVENLCRISYALFPPSYLVSGPYQCTPVLLNHLTLNPTEVNASLHQLQLWPSTHLLLCHPTRIVPRSPGINVHLQFRTPWARSSAEVDWHNSWQHHSCLFSCSPSILPSHPFALLPPLGYLTPPLPRPAPGSPPPSF
uniref:PNPLA domain-containing protein n=1 Tax=Terrapene triunguis TaxID=2587831 RepID=A0A674J792_9SAUR